MDKNQTVISQILYELSKKLKSLSEKQFSELCNGNFVIEFKVGYPKKGKAPSNQMKTQMEETEVKEIADLLKRMEDREKGLSILKERCRKKSDLELLARYLDLPVQRGDRAGKLREKIIASTIGYKLRSNSIQGRIL